MSNQQMMTKVQALLRKAESTNSEAEAELFTNKATELIAKYMLDETVAFNTEQRTNKVVIHEFSFSNPYRVKKEYLAGVVCQAMGAQVVRTTEKTLKVVAFEGDVEWLKVIVQSLILQAERVIAREKDNVYGDKRPWVNSFWLGFANEVSDRLTKQRLETERQQKEHEASLGSNSTELALRSKELEIASEFKKNFPRVKYTTVSGSSVSGRNAGAHAGSNADINGNNSRLSAGGQRALN